MSDPDQIFLNKNRIAWNSWTPFHLRSEFYNNEAFINGENTLKPVEMALLGDITNKKILHLQCHFGQDSMSLARMGAQVTAVDLSDVAIDAAKTLAKEINVDVNFICDDVCSLSSITDNDFDIIFTSYGTIVWLQDLNSWGANISRLLKPGGKFVIVDFHPVVLMFNDDLTQFEYSYFDQGPIVEKSEGSYADRNSGVVVENVSWNHSMSDIVMSLINNGLHIQSFSEYDYSPYNCFNNLVKYGESEYRLKDNSIRIPMLYSLEAVKNISILK